MAPRVQGSAIDDSSETLTNAPDAWLLGRQASRAPVDYQQFVEPGDQRSAVDDRCLTEVGDATGLHHRNDVRSHPSKHDKPRQSRSTVPRSSHRGKRRPSPSFVIRGKNGENIVRSNPFVHHKPSRGRSRGPPPRSEEADSSNQNTSATAAPSSPTFKIRIKGMHGEEAIQDIKRPLFFASDVARSTGSRGTTVVEDSHSCGNSQRREGDWKTTQCKEIVHMPRPFTKSWHTAGHATSPGHTTSHNSSSIEPCPIAPDSSVKMSGALPPSTNATSLESSSSRRRPPTKPTSSPADSAAKARNDRTANMPSSARSEGHVATESNSQRNLSHSKFEHWPHDPRRRLFIVPDDSFEHPELILNPSQGSHHKVATVSTDSSARTTEKSTSFRSVKSPTSSRNSVLSSHDHPAPMSVQPDERASDTRSLQHSLHKSSSKSLSVSSGEHSRSSHTLSRVSTTASQQPTFPHEQVENPSPGHWSLRKIDSAGKEGYYNWRAPQDSLDSFSAPDAILSSLSGGVPLPNEQPAFTKGFSFKSSRKSSTISTSHSQQNASALLSTSSRSSRHEDGQSRHHQGSGSQESNRNSLVVKSRSSHQSAYESASSGSSSRSSLHTGFYQPNERILEWKQSLLQLDQAHTSSSTSRSSALSLDEDEGSQRSTKKPSAPLYGRENTIQAPDPRQGSVPKGSVISYHSSRDTMHERIREWQTMLKTEQTSQAASGAERSHTFEQEGNSEYLSLLSPEMSLPPMLELETIHEDEHEEEEPANQPSLPPATSTNRTTRYLKPGAVTPRPLSSMTKTTQARAPPSVERREAGYQPPRVHSTTESSRSSSASTQRGHGGGNRDSFHSAREDVVLDGGFKHGASAARKRQTRGRGSPKS